MGKVEEFHINYWGANELSYVPEKKGRSLKRKFAIALSFVLLLSLLPTAIFAYSGFNNQIKTTVSTIEIPAVPTPTPNPTPEKKAVINQDTVHSVDSYWKISKRNCGAGKYYLSIQDQNDGKPLHSGDTVIVNCTL